MVRSRSSVPIPLAEYDFGVIRELRQRHGVTLEQVSSATGIGTSTLNRIEKNQNLPSLTTLGQLAATFGMSAANLLDLAGASVVRLHEEEVPLAGVQQRRGVSVPDLDVFLCSKGGQVVGQEPHRHEGRYQTFWVLKGRAEVHVKDQVIPVQAGQALRFDADLEHHTVLGEDTEYLVALTPKLTR